MVPSLSTPVWQRRRRFPVGAHPRWLKPAQPTGGLADYQATIRERRTRMAELCGVVFLSKNESMLEVLYVAFMHHRLIDIVERQVRSQTALVTATPDEVRILTK